MSDDQSPRDRDDYRGMPDDEDGLPPIDHEAWVPSHALESLRMERTVNPTETNEQLTQRIFKENLPTAAASIVHLAVHSSNEKIRLSAAQYVVERNLGKPDTASQLRASADAEAAMWESMIANSIAPPAPAEIAER